MLHSRRNLFKIGGGIFGALVTDKKGFAVEISMVQEKNKRSELEKLASVFEYGVASGDPLSDRVILWTRVTGDSGPSIPVRWQAALDAEFSQVVAEGGALADIDHDFTVKVDAILPFAGTVYYYRFFAQDCWSMVGRTRTAPVTKKNLRLAVVSCSSIWSGYFNAYEAIAKRNDLDLVIHTGDYIYDVPDPDEKRNMPADEINTFDPDSLEAIRQRYRYYRKDVRLRHAHQQHPWVIIWDNHDIENQAGKEASIQAFHEWTPIRSPDAQNRNIIFRKLSFGPMMDLILLDTRHIGRNSVSQTTGEKSILGDEQFNWLKDQLKASKQAQWRVIGNQVLMATCKIFGRPISEKNWDGYAADRDRLLRFLLAEGINNNLVVTGDAHLSFAADLKIDGKSVGVEFLPSSVTRGNLDEQVGGIFEKIAKGAFETVLKSFNPHVRYFESTQHGFGILDLSGDGATMEFWYVPHDEQSQDQLMARAVYTQSASQKITGDNVSATPDRKLAAPAPQEPKLYTSPGEIGGTGGEYFDDTERLDLKSRLSGVSIRCGDRIDSIKASYTDGVFYKHGGAGGRDVELRLNDDEYLRRLVIGIGKHKGRISVHSLRLITSSGRVLEGGTAMKDTIEFSSPNGWHIVGFRGRSGSELDKLGPIFAPDFDE